jgi:hypothetical protein
MDDQEVVRSVIANAIQFAAKGQVRVAPPGSKACLGPTRA